MKSILLSTHPKHIETKIKGLKKMEIRKTKPKELPFKVHEYCTVSGNDKLKNQLVRMEDTGEWKLCSATDLSKYRVNGKVVLEYVVDSVSKFDIAGLEFYVMKDHLLNLSALTETELRNYIGNGIGYAWRISDLKVYDTPLELKEFYKPLSDKDLDEGNYDLDCFGEVLCMDQPEGSEYCQDCEYGGAKPITRPPQSYMFVRRKK